MCGDPRLAVAALRTTADRVRLRLNGYASLPPPPAALSRTTQNMSTALLWASFNGHDLVVQQLLTAGASVEATDRVSMGAAARVDRRERAAMRPQLCLHVLSANAPPPTPPSLSSTEWLYAAYLRRHKRPLGRRTATVGGGRACWGEGHRASAGWVRCGGGGLLGNALCGYYTSSCPHVHSPVHASRLPL